MGQDFPEVVDHAFAGFLRGTVGVTGFPLEECFGCSEQRPAPAVFPSVAVARIDKVLGDDVASHFEPRDIGVEPSSHFGTGEAACCTEFAGDEAAFALERGKNHFLYASLFGVGIDAAAVVAEIGPPFAADERCFFVEKFAVGAAAFLQDGTFPLP